MRSVMNGSARMALLLRQRRDRRDLRLQRVVYPGCAGMTFKFANRLSSQPERMPTPDELPQVYRNY